jgi:hypothetical protein
MKRVAAVLAMTTTMVLSLAGNTSAKVLERDSFHDEFSERVRNFCDVSGLTVRQDFTIDGRFSIKSRGSQQLPYFQQHGRVRVVTTNVATGEFVTEVSRTLEKDLHITNNGDGTLTILVLATGNAVVYDENGKAIARNPGQVRFELLIDHGGTPKDPADDEFIEFLGIVKESTGRSDDFCTAVAPALRS